MLFACALGPDDPPRRTPAAWALVAVLAAFFVLGRLADADLAHGWAWIPDGLTRVVSLWRSDAALYPLASGLFTPAQPWTCALLLDGWWHALATLLALLPAAQVIEARRGPGWLAAMALAVPPLAAAPRLIAGGGLGASIGASGLAAGLLACAWTLAPRAPLRGVAGYWLVVVVGLVRFEVATATLLALFLAQDLARQQLAGDGAGWDVLLAAVVAGGALGAAMRSPRERRRS